MRKLHKYVQIDFRAKYPRREHYIRNKVVTWDNALYFCYNDIYGRNVYPVYLSSIDPTVTAENEMKIRNIFLISIIDEGDNA